MRTRTLLAWIAAGLIGLALAAGVTYAATQLSSQRIGLSAEPPSAGEELAPPQRAQRPRVAVTRQTSTTGSPGARAGDDRGRDDRHGAEEHGESAGRSDWDD
ncbi:MAG TPA: hypothetical protein VFU94_12820 [Conexibacter sp.]|nr:hypothetical protein [Conexibacter sp.]